MKILEQLFIEFNEDPTDENFERLRVCSELAVKTERWLECPFTTVIVLHTIYVEVFEKTYVNSIVLNAIKCSSPFRSSLHPGGFNLVPHEERFLIENTDLVLSDGSTRTVQVVRVIPEINVDISASNKHILLEYCDKAGLFCEML